MCGLIRFLFCSECKGVHLWLVVLYWYFSAVRLVFHVTSILPAVLKKCVVITLKTIVYCFVCVFLMFMRFEFMHPVSILVKFLNEMLWEKVSWSIWHLNGSEEPVFLYLSEGTFSHEKRKGHDTEQNHCTFLYDIANF